MFRGLIFLDLRRVMLLKCSARGSRLPLRLVLPPLHRMHHHWYCCKHTDGSENPCQNLDDLQLMAEAQSSLQSSHATTCDDTPHLMDDDTGGNPEACGDNKKDCMEHAVENLPRTVQSHIYRTQRNRSR